MKLLKTLGLGLMTLGLLACGKTKAPEAETIPSGTYVPMTVQELDSFGFSSNLPHQYYQDPEDMKRYYMVGKFHSDMENDQVYNGMFYLNISPDHSSIDIYTLGAFYGEMKLGFLQSKFENKELINNEETYRSVARLESFELTNKESYTRKFNQGHFSIKIVGDNNFGELVNAMKDPDSIKRQAVLQAKNETNTADTSKSDTLKRYTKLNLDSIKKNIIRVTTQHFNGERAVGIPTIHYYRLIAAEAMEDIQATALEDVAKMQKQSTEASAVQAKAKEKMETEAQPSKNILSK